MIKYYSPIFLLQIFCFYHVYTNSKDLTWYLIILFLPLIGSLAYLYFHFVNNRNIDRVGDSFQNVFSNGSSIDKLKNELEFSETVQNRINLADEYLNRGHTKLAIEQYEKCLIGSHANDDEILKNLLYANFLEENYNQVLQIGTRLKNSLIFNKSKERVALALSYQYLNQSELAEAEFKSMNTRYSNYFQRIKYSEFLFDVGRNNESSELLEVLNTEISEMDSMEKRHNKEFIRDIQSIMKNGWE